jgi:hypothetical protein
MSAKPRSVADFSPSPDLVPIRAIIPERIEGMGAVILMRDGSTRQIIRTKALNFDMKHGGEQAAITYAFGELADSLSEDFPLEITSRAKRLDTDSYARQFDARLASEATPPMIKQLIREHIAYFEDAVKTNNLLTREFFVCVPYGLESGEVKQGVSDQVPFVALFKGAFMSRGAQDVIPTDHEMTIALQQLEMRCDLVEGRLIQIGLEDPRRLNEDALRVLLNELYHPGLAERQAAPQTLWNGQMHMRLGPGVLDGEDDENGHHINGLF